MDIYFYILIFWLGFTILVGAIGRHRNIGFVFAFIWSILLSPLIGLAITLFSKRKVDTEQYKSNVYNQLEQLTNLKGKGILNDTQFEKEKNELLKKIENPINDSSSTKKKHLLALIIFLIVVVLGIFSIRYYNLSKHRNEQDLTDSTSKNDSILEYDNNPQEIEQRQEFGYISGSMYYPGEGVPNSVRLIFENINTGEKIELDYVNCMDDNYYYKMKIPVGSYYVYEDGYPTFAIDDGSNRVLQDNTNKRVYYTASCDGDSNNHKKKIVKVEANKLVKDVIPCDENYK